MNNLILNEDEYDELLNEAIRNFREKYVVEEDPLITFESATQLSHNELGELNFFNRSEKISMSELQPGDYAYINYHRYAGDIGQYALITRKTDKTLFFKYCYNDNNNKILHYECNGCSYDYYYFNITNNNNIANNERKIKIKGTTYKATNNFIIVDKNDWGNNY